MDLSRLLFPKSIAVIGGKPAAEVIRQNDRLGFAGPIFPVHPSQARIVDRAAYRDIDDLPAAPDAVFLAINRHATIDIVARLAERGAGGVVCYASGFAETDRDGAALQRRLCEAAGAMPVLGPNCYGTLNYLDGVALWPDQHGGERVAKGVAIITQSGNIGCNLTMQRRGLPLAFLGTLGNQAMVGLSDMIAALSQDRRVTAIGLHIEGIDDALRFATSVALARSRGIRVVAIKTGVSEAGAALTISHTASLAGADAVASAFLDRVGVGRVRTLPELLETLKLLHVHGPLANADIVSLSCSGGEAALFADRAHGTAICFRSFTPAEHEAVAATVPALVTVSNPFDYHTFHWGNRERLALTFAAVMRADHALTILVLDFPRGDRCVEADWWAAAMALHDAASATGRPAAIVATLPECLPEAHASSLIALGLAPLCGLRRVPGRHRRCRPDPLVGNPRRWRRRRLPARRAPWMSGTPSVCWPRTTSRSPMAGRPAPPASSRRRPIRPSSRRSGSPTRRNAARYASVWRTRSHSRPRHARWSLSARGCWQRRWWTGSPRSSSASPVTRHSDPISCSAAAASSLNWSATARS